MAFIQSSWATNWKETETSEKILKNSLETKHTHTQRNTECCFHHKSAAKCRYTMTKELSVTTWWHLVAWLSQPLNKILDTRVWFDKHWLHTASSWLLNGNHRRHKRKMQKPRTAWPQSHRKNDPLRILRNVAYCVLWIRNKPETVNQARHFILATQARAILSPALLSTTSSKAGKMRTAWSYKYLVSTLFSLQKTTQTALRHFILAIRARAILSTISSKAQKNVHNLKLQIPYKDTF